MTQRTPHPAASPWWRHAAIYQIYIRSFGDGNGDGTGDIAGVRARLPYLRQLGVDALWFNPWYVSPMADAGYDVADYRDIDPLFGTLAEAEQLIEEAHGHELRVIVDLVPNHCSDRHPGSPGPSPPAPDPPSASASGSFPAAAHTANCLPTTGTPTSAAPPGPGSPRPTAPKAPGTCTCSPPNSPT